MKSEIDKSQIIANNFFWILISAKIIYTKFRKILYDTSASNGKKKTPISETLSTNSHCEWPTSRQCSSKNAFLHLEKPYKIAINQMGDAKIGIYPAAIRAILLHGHKIG